MTKLVVPFPNFANAPENTATLCRPAPIEQLLHLLTGMYSVLVLC